ncbi:MAG: hypothetical protein AB1390_01160 [Nitrospirota bacterium]
MMHDPGCRIHDTGCRIHDTGSGCKMLFRIRNLYIVHHESCIRSHIFKFIPLPIIITDAKILTSWDIKA